MPEDPVDSCPGRNIRLRARFFADFPQAIKKKN
jgi:hypothetical protein